MPRALAACFSALALFSCTMTPQTMTPEQRSVRVTSNPDVVRGCQFLGNVSDEGVMFGTSKTSPAERVNNMLRVKTAALGGNVVMLSATGETRSTVTASGEAYKCPAPTPTP